MCVEKRACTIDQSALSYCSCSSGLFRHFLLIGAAFTNNKEQREHFFFDCQSVGWIALDLIQNEAELAAVLAHEIAHVADRHIVKALDIRADDESMTAMVSKIMGSAAESANVIFYQAVDHALNLLFSKGLSREDEYDADLQAVFLSAFAGYDPSAYPRLLARLNNTVQQKRSELDKTHPSFDERIKRIEDSIRNQGLATAESSTNEQRYRRYRPEGG